NVDDGSNTADTTYTITGASIARTGSAAINYSGNITNLLLAGGSGNNIYNVSSTHSVSQTMINTASGFDAVNVPDAPGPLFLNTGGVDTITLSNSAGTLGGIGHVIVEDPSTTSAVTVNDSGFTESTTYMLTSTQLAAAAWPNFLLVYYNVASLNLNG